MLAQRRNGGGGERLGHKSVEKRTTQGWSICRWENKNDNFTQISYNGKCLYIWYAGRVIPPPLKFTNFFLKVQKFHTKYNWNHKKTKLYFTYIGLI